ncbi:YqcC family protein [Guyparkeria sp.]|uniref:YqcC family protein n=1 Tax=Guyparkeria sp. TaxID=2035736 RepID=UPI003970B76A
MDNARPSTDMMLRQLDRIAHEMQQAGLWADQRPDDQALASPHPFCFDTLRFEEWLQWKFLPQMRELLERFGAPPANCSMAPLAEHQFAEMDEDTERLLAAIAEFDALAWHFFNGR